MATAKEVKKVEENDEARLVKVFIPKERGLNAKDKLELNINGKDFVVPLGKEVEIPWYVYHSIECSEADKDFQDNMIRVNSGIREI